MKHSLTAGSCATDAHSGVPTRTGNGSPEFAAWTIPADAKVVVGTHSSMSAVLSRICWQTVLHERSLQRNSVAGLKVTSDVSLRGARVMFAKVVRSRVRTGKPFGRGAPFVVVVMEDARGVACAPWANRRTVREATRANMPGWLDVDWGVQGDAPDEFLVLLCLLYLLSVELSTGTHGC